jgi:hypothetical protein
MVSLSNDLNGFDIMKIFSNTIDFGYLRINKIIKSKYKAIRIK